VGVPGPGPGGFRLNLTTDRTGRSVLFIFIFENPLNLCVYFHRSFEVRLLLLLRKQGTVDTVCKLSDAETFKHVATALKVFPILKGFLQYDCDCELFFMSLSLGDSEFIIDVCNIIVYSNDV